MNEQDSILAQFSLIHLFYLCTAKGYQIRFLLLLFTGVNDYTKEGVEANWVK